MGLRLSACSTAMFVLGLSFAVAATADQPTVWPLAREAAVLTHAPLTAAVLGGLISRPNLHPRDDPQEAGRRLARQFDADMPALTDDVAALYARTFTLEELQVLRDFYATPLGRSIARKQEDMMMSLARTGVPYAERGVQAANGEPVTPRTGAALPSPSRR